MGNEINCWLNKNKEKEYAKFAYKILKLVKIFTSLNIDKERQGINMKTVKTITKYKGNKIKVLYCDNKKKYIPKIKKRWFLSYVGFKYFYHTIHGESILRVDCDTFEDAIKIAKWKIGGGKCEI